MSTISDGQAAFEDDTLRYIDGLHRRALHVAQYIDTIPLPVELQQELQQVWRITRQKLVYFRRELERSEGEQAEELRLLHRALLPQVINYHVKLGELMINDNCDDRHYLQGWQAIWKNFGQPRAIA